MIQSPLIWEALEYEHVERSSDWFWAVGIISSSITIISVILGNIVFAFVILVSVFSLIVSVKRHPKLVKFEISKSGILIDEDNKPYGTLRSFWVDNNLRTDEVSKLYIKPRGAVSHLIIIPIEEINPEDVREFLLHCLLEEELNEPFVQEIFKKLGF